MTQTSTIGVFAARLFRKPKTALIGLFAAATLLTSAFESKAAPLPKNLSGGKLAYAMTSRASSRHVSHHQAHVKKKKHRAGNFIKLLTDKQVEARANLVVNPSAYDAYFKEGEALTHRSAYYMKAKSAMENDITGRRYSSCGAYGPGQLMPLTGKICRLNDVPHKGDARKDPRRNILAMFMLDNHHLTKTNGRVFNNDRYSYGAAALYVGVPKSHRNEAHRKGSPAYINYQKNLKRILIAVEKKVRARDGIKLDLLSELKADEYSKVIYDPKTAHLSSDKKRLMFADSDIQQRYLDALCGKSGFEFKAGDMIAFALRPGQTRREEKTDLALLASAPMKILPTQQEDVVQTENPHSSAQEVSADTMIRELQTQLPSKPDAAAMITIDNTPLATPPVENIKKDFTANHTEIGAPIPRKTARFMRGDNETRQRTRFRSQYAYR